MSVDGLVVVYDCSRLERMREFQLELEIPKCLLLISNKNTIIVGDRQGLQAVNISDAMNSGNINIGKVNALQKLSTKDFKSKQPVFAACTEDGLIRIYRDADFEKSKGFEEIKKLGGTKKNQKGGNQVGATNAIQLENGILIASFKDNSVKIWDAKRTVSAGGCGACCMIF